MPAPGRSTVALALVVALAGIGAPGQAFAQDDSAAGPRFRQAFASLPEGRTVKVRHATSTTVGRYLGVVGDSLSLQTGDDTTTLLIDSVTAAWTRKHNAGKGALIGGIAGVLVGGLLGGAAAGFCESNCDGATAEGIAVGALVIGGASAVVGALIGAAIPGWKSIGGNQ